MGFHPVKIRLDSTSLCGIDLQCGRIRRRETDNSSRLLVSNLRGRSVRARDRVRRKAASCERGPRKSEGEQHSHHLAGDAAEVRSAHSSVSPTCRRYHSLKSTARKRSCGNRSLALTGAALPTREARMFHTSPKLTSGPPRITSPGRAFYGQMKGSIRKHWPTFEDLSDFDE